MSRIFLSALLVLTMAGAAFAHPGHSADMSAGREMIGWMLALAGVSFGALMLGQFLRDAALRRRSLRNARRR